MASLRRTVLFRGQVQGVGFRYTTLQTARRLQMVGTVENLPTGAVRLVAEGIASELEEFVSQICENTSGHVSSIEILEESEATGMNGFQVLR